MTLSLRNDPGLGWRVVEASVGRREGGGRAFEENGEHPDLWSEEFLADAAAIGASLPDGGAVEFPIPRGSAKSSHEVLEALIEENPTAVPVRERAFVRERLLGLDWRTAEKIELVRVGGALEISVSYPSGLRVAMGAVATTP